MKELLKDLVNTVKTYWKTLAFFGAVGLVGGFFTGLYLLDSYPEEIRQEILAQGLNEGLLGLVTALQAVGYGVVLGAIGIFLAKKVGLWKDEKRLEKTPLLATGMLAFLGGLAMILPDLLIFCKYSEEITASYTAKPTVLFMLASVLYGGVIEEVMLRLFFMSLTAFVLWKLFAKKEGQPPVWVIVTANAVASVLFAAGHLPATFALLGSSPIIIVRCFLLNGGIGFLFGYLYGKYGLRYAMLAHGGCHIVSKLIWILFL